MQRDSIAEWSQADLRRFVINLLLSDPGALPKSVSSPSQQLPSGATDGTVPIWDASQNKWVTTATKKEGYSQLNLANSIVDADVSASAALAISKLASYPSDVTKALLGDGSWVQSLRRIFDQTMGGATATFDTGANGVPSTGSHILIVIHGRSDTVASGATVLCRPNNDSGANYYGQLMSAAGTTQTDQDATATGGARIGRISAASAPANEFGMSIGFIPNYNSTSGTKPMIGLGFSNASHTAGSNNTVEIDGYTWSSTSAITRLVMLPGAGNWVAGSRCSIYLLG